MSFAKKNLPVILLLIPCIIIISTFAYAFTMKDNITFVLKDLKGDPSALSDITITGVLQDKYHGQHFTINKGKVTHRFQYYEKYSDIMDIPINYHNAIVSDKLVYAFQTDYKIAPDADTKIISTKSNIYGSSEIGDYVVNEHTLLTNKVEVQATIRIMNNSWRVVPKNDFFRINSGVILESPDLEYEFKKIQEIVPSHMKNEGSEQIKPRYSGKPIPGYNNIGWEKCAIMIDSRLYFTIPTISLHSGENGIFVVEEYGEWWGIEGDPVGKGKKIIKWSLDKHNIDVLGLEAIGNKLVAIMIVDDILTLRVYDTEGGFIDEISFEDMNLREKGREAYQISYETFINDNILNLCFRENIHGTSLDETLISLDIRDEIKLNQKIDRLDFNNEVLQHYNVYSKDNRLYIITNAQKLEEGNAAYDILRPQHFIIMVYQDSKLLYKGELVTDANEDFEIERLKGHSGGFGYDPYMYRQFQGIDLR